MSIFKKATEWTTKLKEASLISKLRAHPVSAIAKESRVIRIINPLTL
jgi:hypothetical protein